MAKVFLSAFLLLALWVTGGFFAFLLLPLLCELPVGWGVITGASLLVAQLLWGQRLVWGLLRRRLPVEQELTRFPQLVAVLDSDCPFALRLPAPSGGAHGLALTKGLLNNSRLDGAMIEEWIRLGPSAAECSYLCRVLALPCLFRAFEAVTSAYGKLRFAEGPLWYLGRFFACIASIIEWPLRLCWGEARPAGQLAQLLATELYGCETVPAWGRALDLLAPVSLSEVQRQNRWLLLDSTHSPEDSARFEVGRCYRSSWASPLLGLAAGLALACSPWQYWGAIPCGLGLGWLCAFTRRWPAWGKRFSWADLRCAEFHHGRRTAIVELEGALALGASRTGAHSTPYVLQDGQGSVVLARVPRGPNWQEWAEKHERVKVWGWWDASRLELQAERVSRGDKRWRDLFRWKYLPAPLMLTLCGLAWWVLQIIGL